MIPLLPPPRATLNTLCLSTLKFPLPPEQFLKDDILVLQDLRHYHFALTARLDASVSSSDCVGELLANQTWMGDEYASCVVRGLCAGVFLCGCLIHGHGPAITCQCWRELVRNKRRNVVNTIFRRWHDADQGVCVAEAAEGTSFTSDRPLPEHVVKSLRLYIMCQAISQFLLQSGDTSQLSCKEWGKKLVRAEKQLLWTRVVTR